jgi:hypothetical protein
MLSSIMERETITNRSNLNFYLYLVELLQKQIDPNGRGSGMSSNGISDYKIQTDMLKVNCTYATTDLVEVLLSLELHKILIMALEEHLLQGSFLLLPLDGHLFSHQLAKFHGKESGQSSIQKSPRF